MTPAKLPKFVIIGAAKSATTWIAHQLRSRDDIFMPAAEPHYFSRDFSRGDDWYRSLFDDAQDGQTIGEKSADYLADADPGRIANLLPYAHLIAFLRNPIDRAYSDYCMLYRRGQIDGNIARQLNRATTDAPRFLDDGLYARHLRRYLDSFPRSQLTLILHEDVQNDPDGCIREVCNAIDVPARIDAAARVSRINDGAAPLVPMAFRRLPKSVKNLAKPFRTTAAFETVRRLVARPVAYPPLTSELRCRLQAFYAGDIEELAVLLGRDLGMWQESSETVC